VSDESATKHEQAQRVREMFSAIAARYDLLNHLLSANVDRRWRRLVVKKVVAAIPATNARVLDVACGTGDLSLALIKGRDLKVVGVDFCRPMLTRAAEKSSGSGKLIRFIEGDALELPFAGGSFDAATIAFGLRNVASVEDGLKELLRVLRPGGSALVLEFSKSQIPVLRTFYRIYFQKILPRLGGSISGCRSAYEYLPESVSHFPDQESLAALMKQVGFTEVRYQNVTGGIAALHIGRRPA
jgi:demethylmenaquinone methyltransferase / 2-methoxy-6-polyprenyl-1,4-benzoquinol methylase